jgi:hypothetical protein
MAYAISEARQQLLNTLAEATDELTFALACLGEAYEQLDDHNGERLEERLFRPVQLAYGQAKRTHAEFSARHGLPAHTFEQASAGVSPNGVAGFLDRALEAIGEADRALASLQDSMLPIEAGDEPLRAGLAAVRDRLSGLTEQAREFTRTLGR